MTSTAEQHPPHVVPTPAARPNTLRTLLRLYPFAKPALPRIEAYALPTEALNSLASAVGLEWVNSDADKISAVQAAMAAEPQPIHVPRLPRPPVVIDEGPLVLVETRKDLSQLKLPFESAAR